MAEAYTTIPINQIKNDRLLFCSYCKTSTSHKVEWLVSPLSLEEECELENSIPQIRQIRKELRNYRVDLSQINKKAGFLLCQCNVCRHYIADFCRIGEKGKYEVIRLFPRDMGDQLPLPNEDMPENCAATYKEAAAVFSVSPRASAGLMRLCLQQFCQELEIQGKTLDEQIGQLVRAGVPTFVQQYMDVCRYVGNSSVHPSVEINVNEKSEVARGLFGAMNIIVENLVSIPKRASEAYAALPANMKTHIEKRDKK